MRVEDVVRSNSLSDVSFSLLICLFLPTSGSRGDGVLVNYRVNIFIVELDVADAEIMFSFTTILGR